MLREHRPHSGEKMTDPRVEALLSAAAAPTEAGRLPGEEEAVVAFRAARATGPAAARPTLTVLKRALAGAVGAGLLLTGGVAAAVTGSLPGAAQHTADGWLEQVGVAVPGAAERAGIHPDERGRTGGTGEEAEDTARTPAEPDAAEKGRQVADLARETEETGADKGAAVSEEASQGRSHAGDEHPGDGAAPTGEDAPKGTVSEAGETHARVEVPNHGAAAGSRPGQDHDGSHD